MKRIILAMAALAAMASCSKSESVEIVNDDELKITSGIATRAVDQKWESGDAIGVFMTTTGSTTSYIGKANTQYSTTSTTTEADFSVVSPDAPLYYPQSGNIDLMAYYPYVSGVTVGAYAVDVATQTYTNKLDLMVAKASNVVKSKDKVALEFAHKLSKVVITLTPASDGGLTVSDLSGVATVLSGTIATATFDLNVTSSETTSAISFASGATTSAITLASAVVGTTSAVITAIVIPQTATPKFAFTLGGTDSYSVTASSIEFKEGYEYNYSIDITKTEAVITGSKISAWTSTSAITGLTATDL